MSGPADPAVLDVAEVGPDPIAACARWVQAAADAGLVEPDAATLATVDAGGRPTARAVLVRTIDGDGFVFFTNETSAKGRAIAAHPEVALTFVWPALRRQVRVEGVATRATAAESDAYFAARPRDRQLAAWASPQSAEVPSRAALDEAYAVVEARFAGAVVPRPPHWGGFRVRPATIELWQGRATRMHDRLRYTWSTGGWVVSRLAP